MKRNPLCPALAALGLLLATLPVRAGTVYYVNGGNPAPASPFTSWASAATNIQDAVNLTVNGDTVLVTNGVYACGGMVMAGNLTNRVALTNAITVQSVNGPWVTTIFGAGAINGTAAVRCAWLTNGAALIGFTLQGGATATTGDSVGLQSGGGVWCASSNAVVGNCVIVSNTANYYGGGVYQGTVQNSLICSNGGASTGVGAAYEAVLINCTIVSNSTYGVVSPMAMTNCLVYFNGNLGGFNYSVSGKAFSHCCTTPALSGTTNITSVPQLMADGIHLAATSPCIGAGINVATGNDIFGNSWSNPPAIGCAEWLPTPVIISPPAIQFPATGGVAVGVNVAGQLPLVCWWTLNGVPLQNNGHYSSANTTALLINNVNLSDAGAYQVVVSNSFGMATSAVSQVVIHCVAGGGTQLPPYTSWATAATNIQDAISVAQAGDIVLVTNGVYAYGGITMEGYLTNRATLNQAIMVQSANGPWVTTIQGGNVTNGIALSRCAWLTNGAALVGFTLQGGDANNASSSDSRNGGGVWCASSNAIIANCIVCSNYAGQYGGGVYQGTLRNCALYGNGAWYGGGTYSSYLVNCTVTANSAYGQCGGAYNGGCSNSIIYYNANNNLHNGNGVDSYCCTYPLPSGGVGNFTNLPQLFVDNVHLFTNSPCIGAGISLGSYTDIEGRPWGNPPSIGCSGVPTTPLVGQPVIQLTYNPVGFDVTAAITGAGPINCWWLENGVPVQNNGHFSSSGTASLAAVGISYSDACSFQLVVSNSFGVVTSAVVSLPLHCVNVNGANPSAPYSTWATAATNIQNAINAAASGDVVLVTNGVYATGGSSMDRVSTNRVSINKAILVQSVNGPGTTSIQGAWDASSTNGPGAVRCVWLTTNAMINGFTLFGGATREYSVGGQAVNGGGVWGAVSNYIPVATVANCVIISNYASGDGAGAYTVNLNNSTLATNIAGGTGSGAGSGGGAYQCNLQNCALIANMALGSDGWGGGLDICKATNCAVKWNYASSSGGGAYSSTMVNCTISGNQVGNSSIGYGGGVNGCTLANSIIWGNMTYALSYSSYSNSESSTFTYCCTPGATGSGNISSNPQLLADGIHLAAGSPCIGAGNSNIVCGTDIDGQPWNNPPSIGCDEWWPAPVIAVQPGSQVGLPAHALTISLVLAGQSPFSYFWSTNGAPLQDDGHHANSATANLTINNFGPADAGSYQVVVTNSAGAVTSAVVQVVIHAVNAAGVNPVPPYSSWSSAAATIQDAINAAAAGDIVLVTNGIYSTGGMVVTGNLTNRVALTIPITVMSVNGCFATAIQGAWDPVSTNGPAAVRCAYVADGASLNGFTLQNGATLATGVGFASPLECGGGVWCNSSNGLVANCVLSNNCAIYGAGIANGTLNNSLVEDNVAGYGGGTFYAILNNCTVEYNFADWMGAGTYGGYVRNSIVFNNLIENSSLVEESDYANLGSGAAYSFSCTLSGAVTGASNILFFGSVSPQVLDAYHLASTSPCRAAGSAQFASGTDLDGQPWGNPPSMGCSEVVVTNLVGPLSVSLLAPQTNVLVNRFASFWGYYAGHAASNLWSFGTGPSQKNLPAAGCKWTNLGDYPVTFTVFNNDHPAGVSTSVVVHVQAPAAPQLQAPMVLTNGLQFQFTGQTNANYTIQYATNLIPPVNWQTLQTIFYNYQSVIQVTDGACTDTTRFYRVLAQ